MKRFQENAQHISERPSPSDRMPGWARSYVHMGETSLDGKTCSSGGAKGRRGVATDSPSLQVSEKINGDYDAEARHRYSITIGIMISALKLSCAS